MGLLNDDLNNLYSIKNSTEYTDDQKELIYMISSIQNIINTRTNSFETRLQKEDE
jgi:hypothetical protein